jgi:hypothetical protein
LPEDCSELTRLHGQEERACDGAVEPHDAYLASSGPNHKGNGASGDDSAMLLQSEEIDMRKSATSKNKSSKPNAVNTSSAKAARTRATRARKSAAAPVARNGSKLAKLVALLNAPSGATIDMMMKSTGWQAHSVRGALSGAISRKLGLKVVSEKSNDVRVYRIAGN